MTRSRRSPPKGAKREEPGPGGRHAPPASSVAGLTHPEWFDFLCSSAALLFIVLALASIPYGAPMPRWFLWAQIACAAAFIPVVLWQWKRDRSALTLWPLLLILACWCASSLTSAFPSVALSRTSGVALYGLVFVAIQVVCRREAGAWMIGLLVAATVVAISADLTVQYLTGESLWRGVEGSTSKGSTSLRGSQGNRNDLGAAVVLMPLCALLGARRTNYRALAGSLGAVVAAPTWIISASRQVLLGWIVAVACVTLTQFRGRSRAIAWIAAVLAGGGLILVSPRVIRRISQLAENPLADRWEPMMLGVELWRSNPIFGVGPSLYGHHYVVAVREGWRWRGEPLPPVGMPWVHSIPIELLCEWGSVGSLAILYVGAVALKSLVGSLRSRNECRLAILGACVLMVLAIVGLLDLTLIKDWCVIAFWLGLGAMYTRHVADAAAGCGVR